MRLAYLMFVLAMAPSAIAQPRADTTARAPLPIPTEWDTFYVAFLKPGPTPADSASPSRTVLDGHIQYQLRLQAEGKAVAAGGFEPMASSDVIGITILTAASVDEARAWVQADPAVQAGLFEVEVRTWYVPAGRLD